MTDSSKSQMKRLQVQGAGEALNMPELYQVEFGDKANPSDSQKLKALSRWIKTTLEESTPVAAHDDPEAYYWSISCINEALEELEALNNRSTDDLLRKCIPYIEESIRRNTLLSNELVFKCDAEIYAKEGQELLAQIQEHLDG